MIGSRDKNSVKLDENFWRLLGQKMVKNEGGGDDGIFA